jgi:hypothetical protein
MYYVLCMYSFLFINVRDAKFFAVGISENQIRFLLAKGFHERSFCSLNF